MHKMQHESDALLSPEPNNDVFVQVRLYACVQIKDDGGGLSPGCINT